MSSIQSYRTRVSMGSRSPNFGALPVLLFYKVFSTWNFAKTVPYNSALLVGIGLSGSEMLLISSILCTKKSLNLSGSVGRGQRQSRLN